jgi:hypothetical protein
VYQDQASRHPIGFDTPSATQPAFAGIVAKIPLKYVILSVAKDFIVPAEILRCTQNDNMEPFDDEISGGFEMFTKYIDPTTDFGFKKLFGEEESKPVLKHFLFDLLELPFPIVELTFLSTEQRLRSPQERKGIFDVYCVDESGWWFIIEMQKN